MRSVVQQLPMQPNHSFVVGQFGKPHFETGWHQHPAHELIFITKGSGHACIGNYKDNFEAGDMYFLGANTVHMFQQHAGTETSALIVQFHNNCLGEHFFRLPECGDLKQLLDRSACGLKITGNTRTRLKPLLQSFETAAHSTRIIVLLQCLQLIASGNEYSSCSTLQAPKYEQKDKDCIDRVFKYTIDSFHEPVSLSQVAAIAFKSVPAFCHYFKRRTQKTYIEYLNEVRVAYACYQLVQTDKPVTDIGYESGYNTVTNFHRQFLRLKKVTPLQYRKLKTWQVASA